MKALSTPSSGCISFAVKSVWYDTVDQPVIPIEVSNSCNEDVVVEVEIRTVDGRKLHSEKIKVKQSEKKSFDITLSDYGDVVLTARGVLVSSGTTIQLGEYKLKL